LAVHQAWLPHTLFHARYWDKDFADIEGVYIKPGGEFLVGIAENKLVAMGALKILSTTEGEIKRMRVDPAYQKRGYGQKILSLLEEKAKEKGLKTLILDTSTIQTVAQHFYKKNGYDEFKRKHMGGNDYIFFKKAL
jgi:N-acetylglutamate synthase-like GNAT family acetyltransferase